MGTRPALLAVVAALALAGCGGDDDNTNGERGAGSPDTEAQTQPGTEAQTQPETGTQPADGPVATIEVRETEFELNPATPTVDEAGLIRIEAMNAGEIEHAIAVSTPGGDVVESDVIDPGGEATIDVELPEGEHAWWCPVGNHRQLGMEGTITVAPGGDG